jgi:hypothetical protein
LPSSSWLISQLFVTVSWFDELTFMTENVSKYQLDPGEKGDEAYS